MASWPPMLAWCVEELGRNWWKLPVEAGLSVSLVTEERIEGVVCSKSESCNTSNPGHLLAEEYEVEWSDVFDGKKTGVVSFYDYEKKWDTSQSWWIELYGNRELMLRLMQMFVGSGARPCWGYHVGKLYRVRELDREWWSRLDLPGVQVHCARPIDERTGRFPFGSLRRGLFSIKFRCEPAYEFTINEQRTCVALHYSRLGHALFPQAQSLIRDVHEVLLANGAQEIRLQQHALATG